MNLQSLRQENGMLSLIKITQNMVKEMKMIQPFNLKQKLLKHFFVVVQMHIFLQQEIKQLQIVMLIPNLHLKIVLRLQNA